MKLTRKHPKIVVVGSFYTDFVLNCARLPKPGETVAGCIFSRYSSGKGANQAVAAARAGAAVALVGAHGDDEFGMQAESDLAREEVDISHFRAHAGWPSGTALILETGQDRTLVAVSRSANEALSADELRQAGRAFQGCLAVLCQLEIPLATVLAAAEISHEHRVPFILNPSPVQPLPKGFLNLTRTLA